MGWKTQYITHNNFIKFLRENTFHERNQKLAILEEKFYLLGS